MANAKIETKDAVAEINKLIESFNLLIKASGDVSTISKANFRKVETALEGLRSVSKQASSSFDKMSVAQQKATIAANQEALALSKQNTELAKSSKEANKTADSMKKLEGETNKASKSSQNLFKELVKGFTALSVIETGIGYIKQLGVSFYNLTKQFDGLKFATEKITGSAFETAASFRYMKEITEEFGVELVSTTERWVKFLAASKQAGVTLKDTQDIFGAVTKAGSVVGLQVDEMQTVYLALEQMMSKGKVTTEELRRQLGEKLPGAVGIMAAAVGVGVNELDSMLKKGEVLSAEVLPRFAKALEFAYGLDTIEKIETITAEQNKLTNSWEDFVRSVSEGSGVIGGALTGIKSYVERVLNALTPQSILDTRAAEEETIRLKKYYLKAYEEEAISSYDKLAKAGQKYSELTKDASKSYSAYLKAAAKGVSDAEIKILETKYINANKLALNAGDKITQIEAETARTRLISTQKQYDEQKAVLDKAKSDLEKESGFTKYGMKTLNTLKNLTVGPTFDAIKSSAEEIVKIAEINLAKTTARLEALSLLSEKSRSAKFKNDDNNEGRKPGKFRLGDVKDLTNEIRIEELKIQKETNDALLAGDQASYQERYDAALENVDIMNALADSTYDESLEKALTSYDKELEALRIAKEEGKIIIGDEEKFKAELKVKYFQEQELAENKRNNSRLDNERKANKEFLKIIELTSKDKLDASEDFYNKEIIQAHEAFEATKKTKKDHEALEKALTLITFNQTKARILLLIEEAEIKKNSGELTATETVKIIELINRLKASIDTLKPEDLKSKSEKLVEILEFIGQVNAELADFGDAIFNRRIENINAEIEAEKNKYDALIDLAKGNKDEQVRLQTEKDAKIKELEAKRLKEEQKQARLRKVSALVEIAINTAIAISKVLGQTGIFGLAAWIPIAALGALQAATVLAQPIPQYKDGLKNAKSDHVGMINDGGRREYIERDGNILSTSTKNAIVKLKKGDTVHKSYDDMTKNSDAFNNLSRSIMLNSLYSKSLEVKLGGERNIDAVFDRNLKKIDGTIKKGFKNVTINSTTKVDMNWIAYKNNTL